MGTIFWPPPKFVGTLRWPLSLPLALVLLPYSSSPCLPLVLSLSVSCGSFMAVGHDTTLHKLRIGRREHRLSL